jgi:hypothetical protein
MKLTPTVVAQASTPLVEDIYNSSPGYHTLTFREWGVGCAVLSCPPLINVVWFNLPPLEVKPPCPTKSPHRRDKGDIAR